MSNTQPSAPPLQKKNSKNNIALSYKLKPSAPPLQKRYIKIYPNLPIGYHRLKNNKNQNVKNPKASPPLKKRNIKIYPNVGIGYHGKKYNNNGTLSRHHGNVIYRGKKYTKEEFEEYKQTQNIKIPIAVKINNNINNIQIAVPINNNTNIINFKPSINENLNLINISSNNSKILGLYKDIYNDYSKIKKYDFVKQNNNNNIDFDFDFNIPNNIKYVHITKNNDKIITVSNNHLTIFDYKSKQIIYEYGLPMNTNITLMNASNKYIIIGYNENNSFDIFDIDKELYKFPTIKARKRTNIFGFNVINTIVINDDGYIVLSSGKRLRIFLLLPKSNNLLQTQKTNVILETFNQNKDINTVAISNNSRIIASGSNNIKIFINFRGNIAFSHKLQNNSEYHDNISALCISNDNDLIVSGTTNGICRVWNIMTKDLLYTISNGMFNWQIDYLKISDNNKYIVFGSYLKNGYINVWTNNKNTKKFQSVLLNNLVNHGNRKLSGNNGNGNLPGNNGTGKPPGNNGNGKPPGNNGNGKLPGNNGNGKLPGNNDNGKLPGNNGNRKLPGNNDNGKLPGNNGNGNLPGNNGNRKPPGNNGTGKLPGNNGNRKPPGNNGTGKLPGNNGNGKLPPPIMRGNPIILPSSPSSQQFPVVPILGLYSNSNMNTKRKLSENGSLGNSQGNVGKEIEQKIPKRNILVERKSNIKSEYERSLIQPSPSPPRQNIKKNKKNKKNKIFKLTALPNNNNNNNNNNINNYKRYAFAVTQNGKTILTPGNIKKKVLIPS